MNVLFCWRYEAFFFLALKDTPGFANRGLKAEVVYGGDIRSIRTDL